jgi:tetratricopeptide (TPR) repeat protein
LRRAISLAPNDAVIRFNLGQCLAEQQSYQAAAECFEKVVQWDPQLTEAKNRLAVACLQAGNQHRKRGDVEKAKASYRKALDAVPQFPEAHNNLGALLVPDDPLRATGHFRHAIATRPDFYEARFNLAGTLALLGNRAEAAEQYRAVLRSRPNLALARQRLNALLADQENREEQAGSSSKR